MLGMSSLYSTNQTDDASLHTALCSPKPFLCVSFRALETDWLLLLLTDPATLSLQQLGESTDKVMWHPSSGCQKMPGTAEAFSFVTLQPTTPPCSHSGRDFCVSASPFDNFSCSSILPTATNWFFCCCILFHTGPLFLWFQCQWYIEYGPLVCWWTNHSSIQWKLGLCQTGLTWIM